jgi:hypothetical protein
MLVGSNEGSERERERERRERERERDDFDLKIEFLNSGLRLLALLYKGSIYRTTSVVNKPFT